MCLKWNMYHQFLTIWTEKMCENMTNHQIGRFCLRCSCKPTSQIPTSQLLHLFGNFKWNATPWSKMPWKFSEHAHQKLIPPQGVKPAWPGPSLDPSTCCHLGKTVDQALQTVRQGHSLQTLANSTKGQALGMDWEGHSGSSCWLLVPNTANSQTQQAVRQAYSF